LKKVKDLVSNLNTKIENLKEWQWFLITFIICIIFIVTMSIEILWQPYIFAEDGSIFLKDAFSEGIKSLNNTYGGYISIVPRIIAIIAIFLGKRVNSIILVINIMKCLSILYIALCINYFNTKEFKWFIKNRLVRFFISLILIEVIANQDYTLYSATYTHWWSGFLAFLVGINFLNKKTPPFYIIPLLMFSILSSPSAILIAIPIMYYVVVKIIEVKKEKNIKQFFVDNKLNIIKLILIAIVGLIEVYSMMFIATEVESITNPNISVTSIITICKKVVNSSLNCVTYSLSCGLSQDIPVKVSIIIGVIVWAILLYRNIKNKNIKIFIFTLIEVFLLYFMTEYKNSTLFDLPYFWTTWYNSVPSAVIILLCIKTLYDDFGKCNIVFKIAIVLLAIIFFIFAYMNIKLPDYQYCNNILEIKNKVDFTSNNLVEIQTAGGNMGRLYVPLKE
jgi:hypothetical protein